MALPASPPLVPPACTGELTGPLPRLIDELELPVLRLGRDGTILEGNGHAQRLLSNRGGDELRRLLVDLCGCAGGLTQPSEFMTSVAAVGDLRVLLTPSAQGFVALLEHRTADRLRAEMAALRSMLSSLGDASPLKSAAERALSSLAPSLRCALLLHRVDDRRHLLLPVAQVGLSPDLAALAAEHPLDPSASTLAEAATRRHPVHLADLSRSRAVPERFLARSGNWSLLALPVRAGSGPGGVLTAVHAPDALGEGGLRLLQGLADAVGALLQRAATDEELAAETEARRSLMENLPDAIVEQGVEGTVSLAAGRLRPILGRSAAEVASLPLEQLLIPEERDLFRQFAGTVRPGSPRGAEFTVLTPDGRHVPCEVSVSATGDAQRPVLRAVFRDITARRSLEGEVVKARDVATRREKLASIGQLAAGVAHEINNPLAFVKSNVGMMAVYLGKLRECLKQADAELQESVEEFVAEMEDMTKDSATGIDRIANIIQALKGMARNNTGAGVAFNPAQVMKETVLIFRGAKHSCDVRLDLQPMPDIVGTPGGLGQIILNLMDNGLDAMGGKGVIEVRGGQVESKVRLSVTDHGTGIPKEIQARIFDPFYTTKEVGKGTGLGLFICDEIVRQMNGVLRFETGPGGTTFFLEFPVSEK
ncbi:MAG: ATP-binding protein [Myxococcales bacterium]